MFTCIDTDPQISAVLQTKYAVRVSDWMDDLLKLNELREKGLLTEEEFQAQKQLIMASAKSSGAPTKPESDSEEQVHATPDVPVMARKMTRRETKASIKRHKRERKKAEAEAKQQQTLAKAEAKLKEQERKGVKAQAKQLKAEAKRQKRERKKAQAEARRQKVLANAEAAEEELQQEQGTQTEPEAQPAAGDTPASETSAQAPPEPPFQKADTPSPSATSELSSASKRPWWKRRWVIILLSPVAAALVFSIVVIVLTEAGVIETERIKAERMKATDSRPAVTSIVPTSPTTDPQPKTDTEDNKTDTESTVAQSEPQSSARCVEDMEQAAAISEYENTWEDTIPTFTSCSSLDEWIEAAQTAGMDKHVGVSSWVPNLCEYELAKLGDTPLCKSVAAAIPSGLDAGWETPPASLNNPGDSKDCDDFPTFVAADDWFNTYAPYYGDVARLDLNQNGFPCEDKPDAW